MESNYANEFILETETDSHGLREGTNAYQTGRVGKRTDWGVWDDMYTLLYLKYLFNRYFKYSLF